MVIDWAIMVFIPLSMEIVLVFQRMDDKVKDGLVLSVIWRCETLRLVVGLCFSFGHTIKGGMDG